MSTADKKAGKNLRLCGSRCLWTGMMGMEKSGHVSGEEHKKSAHNVERIFRT